MVSTTWVSLDGDSQDVALRCCKFDSVVDLQPAVPLRLLVHAAFRSSLGQRQHVDPSSTTRLATANIVNGSSSDAQH